MKQSLKSVCNHHPLSVCSFTPYLEVVGVFTGIIEKIYYLSIQIMTRPFYFWHRQQAVLLIHQIKYYWCELELLPISVYLCKIFTSMFCLDVWRRFGSNFANCDFYFWPATQYYFRIFSFYQIGFFYYDVIMQKKMSPNK
jgi:hypothetical protein